MFTPDGVACCYRKLVRGGAASDRYCGTKGMRSLGGWYCGGPDRARCCAKKAALDTDRFDPACDPSAPRPPPPPPKRPPRGAWLPAPCWTSGNLAQCCKNKRVFDSDCTPTGGVVPCARAVDGPVNCCERRRRTNDAAGDPSCSPPPPPPRCYLQRSNLTACCRLNPRDPDCTPSGDVLPCSKSAEGAAECCIRRRQLYNVGRDPSCAGVVFPGVALAPKT